MKWYIVFPLFIVLATGCKLTSSNSRNENDYVYPEVIDSCNIVSIKWLHENDPKTGCFTVSGYVYKKYECPPCPPGELCKPCPPEYIFVQLRISKSPKGDLLTNHDIVIQVKGSKQFETGKLYQLSFNVLSDKTMHFKMQNGAISSLNDLVLTGYDKMN